MSISWKAMAALTAIVTVLLSCGVYYTLGMPTEEHTVATLCTYEQNTRCDYIAYLKPNILYGETIGEGETIYLSLVNRIDVTFNYTFECSETGSITTEYLISSVLEDPSETGWSKGIDELVSVETAETENATSATLAAKFSYNITEISELVDKIEETIGVSSSTYQTATKIMINTTDETGVGTISKPLEESVVLKLNYMGGYTERGGVIQVEAPEKHLSGSIKENYTKELMFAVQLRIAMFVALIAWILVGPPLTAWRYKAGKAEFETLPESERIMKRFKMIESRDTPKLKVQTLSSIEDLKKVADDYDSTLFHTKLDGNDVFFTTIENITYQYIAKPVQKTE
jgi:hypothetical protein